MRSSERARAEAHQRLEALLALLDERAIAERVDAPVDRALAGFRFTWSEDDAPSVRRLHGVAGRLVAQLEGSTTADDPQTENPMDRDRAVAWLEAHRGPLGGGWAEAHLEVVEDPEAGINRVLAGLGEAVKAQRRQRYRRSICASRIETLDWDQKRELVAAILDRFGADLPPRLAACDPAALVDQIEPLLREILDIRSFLRSVGDSGASHK